MESRDSKKRVRINGSTPSGRRKRGGNQATTPVDEQEVMPSYTEKNINKKTPTANGTRVEDIKMNHHQKIKHLFKPFDETMETAMDVVNESESSGREDGTEDENSKEENSVKGNKQIDHEVIDKWLYDATAGPIKELIKKGLKTQKMEFQDKLKEILKGLRETKDDTEESRCKIETIEQKVINGDKEFEVFKRKLPRGWITYNNAMLQGRTVCFQQTVRFILKWKGVFRRKHTHSKRNYNIHDVDEKGRKFSPTPSKNINRKTEGLFFVGNDFFNAPQQGNTFFQENLGRIRLKGFLLTNPTGIHKGRGL